MKKLLILGVALACGLSACTLGFGPVPPIPTGWAYQIQAHVGDIDGDILCPLTPDYEGWPSHLDAIYEALAVSGISDTPPFGVATGPILEIPFGDGEKGVAYIESLVPYWTLWPDAAIDAHWSGALCENGALWCTDMASSFGPVKKEGDICTMEFLHGTDVYFTVSWKERDLSPAGGVFTFPWPKFNGEVVIERVDPLFAGYVYFTVTGANMWNHGFVYSAFIAQFGTIESGLALILDEFEVDMSGYPGVGGPGWDHSFTLPVWGGTIPTPLTTVTTEWAWNDKAAKPEPDASMFEINPATWVMSWNDDDSTSEQYLTATITVNFMGKEVKGTKDFVLD